MGLIVHFYKRRGIIGSLISIITLSKYCHCITEINDIFLDISIKKKSIWHPSYYLRDPNSEPDCSILIDGDYSDIFPYYLDQLKLTGKRFGIRTNCVTLSKKLLYYVTARNYKGISVGGYKRHLENLPTTTSYPSRDESLRAAEYRGLLHQIESLGLGEG